MKTKSQNIQRYFIATALTFGLASIGLAANAQGAAPAAPATASNGSNVSMSTTSIDSAAKRRADLAEINADARRVEFRLFGTSM